jgi:hypothetical protein
MGTFEKLDAKFDLPEAPSEPMALAVQEEAPIVHVSVEPEDPIQQDAERARDTIHELIDKGLDAVDTMLAIAKQSDHPRAFEVTGQLVKTVSELAKDLLVLQKQAKELREGPTPEKNKGVINQHNNTTNVVFAGTTRELFEAMRKNREQIPEAFAEVVE